MNEQDKILWQIGKEGFVCQILPQRCAKCHATGTLVGLPPPILVKQPDDTNVVCHPGLGGCNHGFNIELLYNVKLYRRVL